MRRGGGILVAAVLALAGCKSGGTRPADPKDKTPGAAASRPKGKDIPWLDEALAKLPGGDTNVPKAGSWADPKSPNFNPAAEGRGVLAGRVLDPYNQPAKSVFIRIEAADARPGERAAAGVYTDNAGYFFTNGLKAGQAYTLTVNTSAESRPLFASVQTRPPNSALVLVLRDDLAPGGAGGGTSPPVPPGTTVLPPPTGVAPPAGAAPPPGVTPPVTGLPPASDNIPPIGLTPPPPRPADGNWSPSGSARPGVVGVPPTLGSPPGPPPAVAPPAGTAPERTAEGPPVPGRPPATSIPGPAFPALPVSPAAPPPLVVPPPAGPTGKLMSNPRSATTAANVTLIDALDREWNFASHKHGSLVLLDFMTTTCAPCKRAIPTLMELQSRYAGEGLELIGVVCDDVSPRERTALAARYQRENNLNYVLYTEPGELPGAVRDRFGVNAYPTVVLLGPDGSVLYKGHPGQRTELEAAIQRHLRR
ncbi:redoxin domain-containing protein [bacterium]|nr:redoxin domain-containing protein [bacterium]